MNFFIIYMVKIAFYLAAFYLVYSLFLKSDTTYVRNRAYILLSVFVSILLPFISFTTQKPLDDQLFGKLLSEVTIRISKSSAETTFDGPLPLIFTIYISGVILFIFKLVIDFSNLLWLIVRRKKTGSRIIRFQGLNTSAFSAMGYIFINTRLSPEDAGEIINHEKNHLKQNHYLDIIFIELVTSFQWFNPFIYLFNRELRALHEYQADNDCLSAGIPIVNYQSLLLSQVFRSGALKLTNSFSNPSLLRKRMIMMTKKRSSQLTWTKMLLVIPVAGIVFLTVSAKPVSSMPPPPPPQTVEQSEDELNPFVVVEEMPMFPGGDGELLKYLAEKTIYPDDARQKNIQGRVIIRFCVTATGGVSKISVLKGVDPTLDKEAIRVVGNLPAFKPGKQGGKAVPVWYMVPITFTLK
jgi:TonB family protein